MPEHSDVSRDVRLVDIVLWSIVGALLVGALASTIGILAREVYSPRGLVNAYLGAVADHDVQSALAFPGVAADGIRPALEPQPSRELLRSDVLGDLTDVEVLSDDEFGTGRHRVTVSYRIDGEPGTSSFMVEPNGNLGVFTLWRFAASPLGILKVDVKHANTFTVAGHTLDARAATPKEEAGAFNAAGDYFVFVPSRYRLAHDSALLMAPAETTTVTKTDAGTRAEVVAHPKKSFTQTVQKELDKFLDQCATQDVLKPAGCPFGTEIDDRVKSDPQWSIVSYPPVALEAGTQAWRSAPAAGAARIQVEVRSLFDGSVSTVDRTVDFAVALDPITIDGEGSVHIQLASVD